MKNGTFRLEVSEKHSRITSCVKFKSLKLSVFVLETWKSACKHCGLTGRHSPPVSHTTIIYRSLLPHGWKASSPQITFPAFNFHSHSSGCFLNSPACSTFNTRHSLAFVTCHYCSVKKMQFCRYCSQLTCPYLQWMDVAITQSWVKQTALKDT